MNGHLQLSDRLSNEQMKASVSMHNEHFVSIDSSDFFLKYNSAVSPKLQTFIDVHK